MVAPSQASLDAVTSYFQERGVSNDRMRLNPSQDFMTVSMTVTQAESIFQVPNKFIQTRKERGRKKTKDILIIV